ncbi:DUF6776 family protein [Psychromonas algicola]|uniref:DUF6776 family protein n=1 Tax=Psychromonas algicola TaxID=2555642 RepID=UPI00106755D1|nr:DUF6776 family protein [Psychromonas sp. RZ5]TEW44011.1 hypothetical protein E2R67_15365 [Psychromonas sp. RZ5]
MRRFKMSFFKWLTISFMCLYFGFMVGKFKQDILYNQIQLLALDATNLTSENHALLQKLSILQADFFAKEQANLALVAENKKLNEALDTSNNKLYFYEQVVAPELGTTGLNVYAFKVKKVANSNAWSYELVLMQDQKRRRLLNGSFDVIFSPADDAQATQKSIKLSELDKHSSHSFKFKYFQTLKGQFVLPDDLQVDQVFVIAQAAGNRWNRAQRIEKIYDWKEFIEKGGLTLKELAIQAEDE